MGLLVKEVCFLIIKRDEKMSSPLQMIIRKFVRDAIWLVVVDCIFGLKIHVSPVQSQPGPPSNTKFSHLMMAFLFGIKS